MLNRIKYKVIAAFFLTVFSLGTVAGFACSIGIDMGYNTKHHELEDNRPDAHVKAHSHSKGHQHEQHQKSSTPRFSIKSGDDCCAGDVTSFIKLDKAVANTNFLIQPPVFLLSFTSIFLLQNDLLISPQKHFYHPRQRWRSLNDTDIRIAIQSFQI